MAKTQPIQVTVQSENVRELLSTLRAVNAFRAEKPGADLPAALTERLHQAHIQVCADVVVAPELFVPAIATLVSG